MRLAILLAALLLSASAVSGAAASGSSRADNPILTGEVGINDSFSITLSDPSGALVTHVDPGTYTLVVHDHSAFHNFHFSGPGVDVMSSVDGTGDSTYTVTLTDGTYFFQCDPHSGQMHGTFTVGTVAATPPATPPAPTSLTASLAASGASTIRPAAGLSAGSYVVTVTDQSAKDGFKLSGPGVSKATGAKFKGKATWKITLVAGRYAFGSALHPKLRHTITISP